jgi:Aldo/keto reductase family
MAIAMGRANAGSGPPLPSAVNCRQGLSWGPRWALTPPPATSAGRARRSADESLERLGLPSFQLLYLHDPERIGFSEAMTSGGPVDALISLRDAKAALHIGVAGGPLEMMEQFIGAGVFEVVLTHNRFTLVDRSAERLFDKASAARLSAWLRCSSPCRNLGSARQSWRRPPPSTWPSWLRRHRQSCPSRSSRLAALAPKPDVWLW